MNHEVTFLAPALCEPKRACALGVVVEVLNSSTAEAVSRHSTNGTKVNVPQKEEMKGTAATKSAEHELCCHDHFLIAENLDPGRNRNITELSPGQRETEYNTTQFDISHGGHCVG
jgi:hypothetical protein